jgi:hypothetical protein
LFVIFFNHREFDQCVQRDVLQLPGVAGLVA